RGGTLRNEMKRRPSGPYFPVCRSPLSESGSSRGVLHVFPSSRLNMTCEFLRREFSRRRMAISLPSGERMNPGSHRCTAVLLYTALGVLHVRPPSCDSVL